MTWTYSQSDGELAQNGAVAGTGYSGTGEGRNNPAMQNVQNVGPIPTGRYTIGDAHAEAVLGPVVMDLIPVIGTQTFGRSLFRIHGNNAENDASHGCIILSRPLREMIASSNDTTLLVTI